MTELDYDQQRELREMLTEAFSYDAERRYAQDTAVEIVDHWVAVYYNEIRDQWVRAGCPEPEESLANYSGIHHAMQAGLYDVGCAYALQVIGNADTHEEALEPVKDADAVTECRGKTGASDN